MRLGLSSLKSKLLLNAILMTALIAAVAGVGIWSALSLTSSMARYEVAAIALQNHQAADMMHDALRGDALAAIQAGAWGTPADRQAVQVDLQEHVANFQGSVDANLALDLPEEIRVPVTELEQPLRQYKEQAQRIVDLGVRDHQAALAAMPAFLAAFSSLEDSMGRVSDEIGKVNELDIASNHQLAGLAIKLMLGALGLGVAAAVGVNLLIGRSVLPPITRMTDAMSRLAAGDLDADIPAVDQDSEIGRMAAAVQVFKDNAIENVRLTADRQETEKRNQADRRAALHQIASDFESRVGSVIDTLAAAATQMEVTAQTMSSEAEQTNRQSASVAASSEQTASNVQTVASATEQMAASIREIGSQVTRSSVISGQAVDQAQHTTAIVRSLADGATRIGEIIQLITEVANQTNLLALNATIEAARAGEAGRGFAVVASEVKNLAAQTARATGEISATVQNVQASVQQAVGAIDVIGSTIAQMNEIASAIAAAIEEQGAATQEIALNVNQAAQGTQIVFASISDVQRGAAITGEASVQMLGSAGELARNSSELRLEVDRFLAEMRVG